MTIYDIAKMADVSASSVSRVINNKPGVNREKRERIKALLREYNYVPDNTARSLVRQATRTVGILTDDIETMHLSNTKAKIEQELMRSGYYCFVHLISGPEAIEEGVRTLAGLRVEGAIFLGLSFRYTQKVRDAVARFLPETPVVMMHHNAPDLDNMYLVSVDQKIGFSRAVSFLYKRGRRHLALLVNESRFSSSVIRSGFEEGLRLCEGTDAVSYTDIPATVTGGEKAAKRLFQEHPETDGVICTDDLIAIGVLNYLQSIGVSVPEDVSVIGEDNSAFCQCSRPQLSSLDNMVSVSSVLVTRTLLDAMQGRSPSRQTVLEMEIVERQTT